jgi:hypothetical protein
MSNPFHQKQGHCPFVTPTNKFVAMHQQIRLINLITLTQFS